MQSYLKAAGLLQVGLLLIIATFCSLVKHVETSVELAMQKSLSGNALKHLSPSNVCYGNKLDGTHMVSSMITAGKRQTCRIGNCDPRPGTHALAAASAALFSTVPHSLLVHCMA